MRIYRIKSFYHLMQVFQIIDFDYKGNILIINHESIKYLLNKKSLKNIFSQIIYYPYKKGLLSNLRLALEKKRYYDEKFELLVSPEHEIDHMIYKYYKNASKIEIINDGNISYVDSLKKYPYYLEQNNFKSMIKKIFGIFGILNYLDPRIKKFYVSDKKKIMKTKKLSKIENYNYVEIDILNNRKIKDGYFLKEFINDLFDFKLKKAEFCNSTIVISEPLIEDKRINLKQFNGILKLFEIETQSFKNKYIKFHPREIKLNKYKKMRDFIYIDKDIPFELFLINEFYFDKGITYNSSAINYNCFKQKVILKESYGLKY